ncbi:MAG: ribonuclease Z [Flavobacteriaceae bacterium]|nr:ribonuclease Z [Flavobacteriaceae bacterium]
MALSLTILGCHSATPRTFAYPTSQFLSINNEHFLIDCGEGTQVQLRKHKVKFSKISRIFISHLHGDHYFGLIGLISTFSLYQRQTELHIYGPKGLKEITKLQLKLGKSFLSYEIIFHELTSKKSEVIFENNKVSVATIPLKHRVYTNGFIFKEKIGERKLNISAISQINDIKNCDYQNLKNGKDFTKDNGDIIKNTALTFKTKPPKSYAFCSDTCYKPNIVPIIKEVNLLYHESTFLEDKSDLAKKTLHSTAKEAAKIANDAQVEKLILGHFSSRYTDETLFLKEAITVFEKTILAKEGLCIEL